MSVSLHDETEPCDIRLSIEDDKDYKVSQDLTIAPYSTKMVEFAIGELQPGNYKLVAEGLTNIIFKNETNINLNGKKFSVLMQTDKAIYKPADTIRFRVLVLDPNMKPITIAGSMLIYITVHAYETKLSFVPYIYETNISTIYILIFVCLGWKCESN